MVKHTRRIVIYSALLCTVLLLSYPVLAATTATITISGVIPEPQTEKVKRPVALFNTDPKVGSAPLTVTFTDKSQHKPSAWNWSFGDGTYSNAQNPPPHTYTLPGIYYVYLTATNSAGSDVGMRFVFTMPRWDWWHGKKNK